MAGKNKRYGYLTEITNENTLGPDLATDWQAIGKDDCEWRFEPSRNATFHDGRAVTAKAVIASMDHHRGPDTTSAVAPLLTDITDIRFAGIVSTVLSEKPNTTFTKFGWIGGVCRFFVIGFIP